jgi:glycosyltransferase involved in cell wall biosynthesis
MRVAILRREPRFSFSMDVYADNLISGLKQVRPSWEIVEFVPELSKTYKQKSWQQAIWSYYERYRRYPFLVSKQQADIFHIIDHSHGHIARWLKRNNRIGIVTCHDLINLIQPENVYDQTRFPIISMSAWKYAIKGMHQAAHIISVSSHTAQDIVRELKIEPEQITVVPNGVEPIFRLLPQSEIALFRQQNGLSPETLCILNVGSNHPRKNVFTILKVIKALKDKGLLIKFWKAGSDFTAKEKKFIQTHSLEHLVTYLGKPDKQSLVQIYNAADILLSPSLYEGFGITILEAMACGTVVITSKVTSLPEVAGDAAILVEPTDVTAIVKAIDSLLEESSHRKLLVERGLARAKIFSWEKTAEEIAQVYEKVLEKEKKNLLVN